MEGAIRSVSLFAISLGLLSLGACGRWEPNNPVAGMAALDGAHRTAPCETCHVANVEFDANVLTCNGVVVLPGSATGTATSVFAWQSQCLACHDCERPLAGDEVCGEVVATDHFPGVSCGESGCHAFADTTWGEDDKCLGGGTQPTACTTCHDQQLAPSLHGPDGAPESPSHTAHLDSALIDGPSCADCHPDAGFSDPRHDDGTLDIDLAEGVLYGTWELATKSCEVSCHGASTDGGATYPLTYSRPLDLPVWDAALPDGCAACHGAPPVAVQATPLPVYHVGGVLTQCDNCHEPTGGPTADALGSVATHLDGIFQCTAGNCP